MWVALSYVLSPEWCEQKPAEQANEAAWLYSFALLLTVDVLCLARVPDLAKMVLMMNGNWKF